jgi:Ala-tRNA(Pro) deacylase
MKELVYKYLKELNIEFEIHNHPALYTCADSDKYGLAFDAISCKNLFLRNKKKTKFYLISMPENKQIKLNELAVILKEQKLSFANEEDLLDKLKVKPGAVSILNVIGANLTDVMCIVDKELINANKVGFHPNDNTATILFDGKYIEIVLKTSKASYSIIAI